MTSGILRGLTHGNGLPNTSISWENTWPTGIFRLEFSPFPTIPLPKSLTA